MRAIPVVPSLFVLAAIAALLLVAPAARAAGEAPATEPALVESAEEAPPATALAAPCFEDGAASALPQSPLSALLEALEPTARPPRFRTCRCSCGQPCTTDADCWGGRCTSGITCCSAPLG